MGRRGAYKEWITPDGLQKVADWLAQGLTDKQLAMKIGINPSTLYEWENKFPEFKQTVEKGKDKADESVENALFKTAVGDCYQEEKTTVLNKKGEVMRTIIKRKKIAPNATSAMCWLKHKHPEKWGDW